MAKAGILVLNRRIVYVRANMYNRYRLEVKSALLLFIPLLASLLAQKCMSVVNSIFMGTLGSEALAASSLGDSLCTSFYVFGMGILSAVGVFVARAYAQKNKVKVALVLYTSLVVTFIFSTLTIAILWFAPNFLVCLGQDHIVVGKTVEYVHMIIWGLPALLSFFAMLEFSSALNHPRISVIFSALSVPLVILANSIFIYGKFGLPAMGIAGIGLSTTLVQWIVILGFYLYNLFHPKLKKYVRSFQSLFSKKVAKDLLKLGVPVGFTYVLENGMSFAATLMMGQIGTNALASHQITTVVTTVLCRFTMAMGITCAIRVSQKVGAKQYRDVRTTLNVNLLLGTIMAVFMGILLILFSDQIINVFINRSDSEFSNVLMQSHNYIIIGALVQLADYYLAILSGALRGLKDTFVPMWICLISYWLLGVGLGYILGFVFHLEGIGVWIGQFLGVAVGAIVLYIRFNRTYNKSLEDIAIKEI